jgi:hypothetical protein
MHEEACDGVVESVRFACLQTNYELMVGTDLVVCIRSRHGGVTKCMTHNIHLVYILFFDF